MLVSGTFASRSKDRRSSEAEADGAWDSFWLEVTIGRSKGENSEAKGTPGEAAFLLRKAVRRMRSLRFVEGDLVFFLDLSKSVGNGRPSLVSEQKLKEKADPMLIDIFTTKPME